MPIVEKQRVLIVDDVLEHLQVLTEILRDEFAVMVAKDGSKALSLAVAAPRPDIILLDVMMPGMDGYEVCLWLKADPRTANIPVLFVTSLADDEDEARGLALGAVDYITKPFHPGLVKMRVRNQLELKRHRDDLDKLVRERTRELVKTQQKLELERSVLRDIFEDNLAGYWDWNLLDNSEYLSPTFKRMFGYDRV